MALAPVGGQELSKEAVRNPFTRGIFENDPRKSFRGSQVPD